MFLGVCDGFVVGVCLALCWFAYLVAGCWCGLLFRRCWLAIMLFLICFFLLVDLRAWFVALRVLWV